MPGLGLGAMPTEMSMPTLMGDFYHEHDTVTRGLSLYCGAEDFMLRGDEHMFGKDPSKGAEPLGMWDDFSKIPLKERSCEGISSRFQETEEAAQVPEDSFFQLERTTIVIYASSAASIGNRMLDFLAEDASAHITKVNCIKFTIKAEVCIDGLCCETKVRIYRQSLGQYAVEMQRRGGDSLAFHRLYEWASQCLNSNDMGASVEKDHANVHAMPTFESAPLEECAVAECSLEPLLDLAQSSNVDLQAEALQAMLKAASDVNLIVHLCTPHAFCVFQSLMQIVCYSITEPLTNLLCCLAMIPQAGEHFTNQQMLLPMIKTVGSTAVGHSASKEMAQAVCHVIAQNAARISPIANQELRFALTEKLGGGSADFQTAHYLEESLHVLNLFGSLQAEQACF